MVVLMLITSKENIIIFYTFQKLYHNDPVVIAALVRMEKQLNIEDIRREGRLARTERTAEVGEEVGGVSLASLEKLGHYQNCLYCQADHYRESRWVACVIR